VATLKYTLESLNKLNLNQWKEALGWVFEHSPWVAERAWTFRPYSSIGQLHQTMLRVVNEATLEEQLTLIRSHPNLATKLQMSEISQQEQQGVGLDQLSPQEFAEFTASNNRYMQQFNFPFILAVRSQTKESILASMQERIHYTPEVEQEKAMQEIHKITLLRLNDLILN
jgi:OHCU decarboxylase